MKLRWCVEGTIEFDGALVLQGSGILLCSFDRIRDQPWRHCRHLSLPLRRRLNYQGSTSAATRSVSYADGLGKLAGTPNRGNKTRHIFVQGYQETVLALLLGPVNPGLWSWGTVFSVVFEKSFQLKRSVNPIPRGSIANPWTFIIWFCIDGK